MRSTERNLVAGIAVVVLIAAFYLLVLAPKRDRASQLSNEATSLQQSVSDLESRAEAGAQAKNQFSANYRKVVLLGKAAPDFADSASFLYQLSGLAEKTGVKFEGLLLVPGEQAPAAAPQPGIANAPAASSQPSATDVPPASGQATSTTASPATTAASPTTTTAVAPTEAAVSTVPIGAGVGPAGLNTLKYTLTFQGDFFHIADFMQAADRLVGSSDGRVVVDGRLSTVNGFSLSPGDGAALTATLSVTTYTTPQDQGLTAGATPSGPSNLPSDTPQLASQEGAAP
jgi:hypothetical protein